MISHRSLLECMKKLGYAVDEGGMCFGFAHMAMQAILTGDLKTYNQRLTTLQKILLEKKDLLTQINLVREKVKNIMKMNPGLTLEQQFTLRQRILTSEEQDVLSIPAFFDGVALYHAPAKYPHLFEEFDLRVMKSLPKENEGSPKNTYIFVNQKPPKLYQFDAKGNKLEILLSENELIKVYDILTDAKIEAGDSARHLLSIKKLDELDALFTAKDGVTLQARPRIQNAEQTFRRVLPSALVIDEKKDELSRRTEKSKIKKIDSISGIYNIEELKKYFEILLQVLKEQNYDEPISFILCSSDHCIVIGYDPQSQGWQWISASNSEEIDNSQEIAKKVMYAFSNSDFTTFVTEIYVNDTTEKKIKEFLAGCKQKEPWKKLFKVTKETAQRSDSMNASWLYIATQNGHLDIVKLLIQEGKANPNQANKNGSTPLLAAARRGHLDIVKFLIQEGKANPNQACTIANATPFYIAAQNGHIEIVKFLLQEEKTAVSIPILASTQILLEGAKQINRENEIKNLLTKNNTRPLPKNLPGFTSLHAAIFFQHYDIVRILLDHQEIFPNNLDVIDLALALNRIDIFRLLENHLTKKSQEAKEQSAKRNIESKINIITEKLNNHREQEQKKTNLKYLDLLESFYKQVLKGKSFSNIVPLFKVAKNENIVLEVILGALLYKIQSLKESPSAGFFSLFNNNSDTAIKLQEMFNKFMENLEKDVPGITHLYTPAYLKLSYDNYNNRNIVSAKSTTH